MVAWETGSAAFAGKSATIWPLPSADLESLAPETEAIWAGFQTEKWYWRPASPETASVRRSCAGDQVSETTLKPSDVDPRAGKVES